MGKRKKLDVDIDGWVPILLEELGRQLQEIGIIRVACFSKLKFVKDTWVDQESYNVIKSHFGFVAMLRSRPDLFCIFGVPDDSVSEQQVWLRSPGIAAEQNCRAAPCKHFMHEGRCDEGRSCRFRHDPADYIKLNESTWGWSAGSSRSLSFAVSDGTAIAAVLKAAPDHVMHYQAICSKLGMNKKTLLRIVTEHPEVFETRSSKKYAVSHVCLRMDALVTTAGENQAGLVNSTDMRGISESHEEFDESVEDSFFDSWVNDAEGQELYTANEAHCSIAGAQSNHNPYLAKRPRPSQAPHLRAHSLY